MFQYYHDQIKFLDVENFIASQTDKADKKIALLMDTIRHGNTIRLILNTKVIINANVHYLMENRVIAKHTRF